MGSVKKEEKILYLTFDDGPDRRYTWKLLELLAKYNVRASFFVVASFAGKNPEIMEKMKAEGHLIGLHSLEHKDAYLQAPGYTKRDFAASMRIMEGLGIHPQYFRPPWGHHTFFTDRETERYGLHPVYWDVMAQDWRAYTSAAAIVGRLKRRTAPGAVICLHDGRGRRNAPERMILALRVMIPYWLQEGYTFQTIDSLGGKTWIKSREKRWPSAGRHLPASSH